MSDNTPKMYNEIPIPLLKSGPALQHDGTTESAAQIVDWLRNNGVEAWLTPYVSEYTPAVIRIDVADVPRGMRYEDYGTVWKNDWVMLLNQGSAVRISQGEFSRRYRSADDPAEPLYSVPDLLDIVKSRSHS